MAEVHLNGPRVGVVIGQLIAAGMAQHDQKQGHVPMPVPTARGYLDQPFDFGLGTAIPLLSGPMSLLRKRAARRGIAAIEPCLPSPARQPPSGLGWLHKIKHDGVWLIARREPLACACSRDRTMAPIHTGLLVRVGSKN